MGQHKAQLSLIPVFNGHICSLGHVSVISARGEILLGLPEDTAYLLSAYWLSHLAPTGSSFDAPNKKQGLDLLLRTHSGCIFLGFIFVVLLHADFHEGLCRRRNGWRKDKA